MPESDGPHRDLAVGVRARPAGAAPVVFALAAAFAFGAIDQWLPAAGSPRLGAAAYQFVVQVSNGMSALWLLAPFLAGAWQASVRRAALVGLAATWMSVLGYVLMVLSPVEGARPTPGALAMSLASQWPWFAGGLIAGPLYGWLGHRWRARRSRAAALPAALPVLLEPGARWLAADLGLGKIPWIPFQWPLGGGAVAAEFAELAAGLLLTSMATWVILRSRASAEA